MIYDEKTLKQVSKDLIRFDNTLENDLLLELTKCSTGVGLSAIQIGIPSRMAVVKLENGDGLTLWDANIVKRSVEWTRSMEGCLSIPGKRVDVIRWKQITVKNGDGKHYVFYGMESRIVQHEIDHWLGVLITDYEKDQDTEI